MTHIRTRDYTVNDLPVINGTRKFGIVIRVSVHWTLTLIISHVNDLPVIKGTPSIYRCDQVNYFSLTKGIPCIYDHSDLLETKFQREV